MERHRRTWCLTASAALALVVAPLQSGCNIIAPAYFIIHGPPKVPALYVLPDRPTVVFVDDRRNVIATNADRTRRLIAEVTSNELMTKGVLAVTIRPQDALALAKQVDRHKSVLAIDALGEAVGRSRSSTSRWWTFGRPRMGRRGQLPAARSRSSTS